MKFSKCMDIVNRLDPEDMENVLAKLDQYTKMGVPPQKAQRMAAKDALEELKSEFQDFMRLVTEQHPEPKEEPLKQEVQEPVQMSERDQTYSPKFKKWFGDWEAVARQKFNRSVIERALKDKQWQERTLIAKGDDADPSGKLAEAFGFAITKQYITPDDIRKTEKKHGTGNERDQDQIGLSTDDFVKLVEVLRDPQTFKLTRSNNGKQSAEFGYKFSDGTFVVAEVEVAEPGAVSVKTGWKKVPGRNHVGGKAFPIRTSKTTPRVDSSMHSDSLLVNPDEVSKVVDADGKPLVVYHGSYTKGINTFEPGRAGGIYFTPSQDHAKRYGPDVTSAYLKITKLGDLTDPNSDAYKLAVKAFNDAGGWASNEDAMESRESPMFDPKLDHTWEIFDWPEADIQSDLFAAGYDGFKLEEYSGDVSYVVFDPAKIKSAIGNNGEFDGTNPDIRHSMRSGTSTWDMYDDSKFDDVVYKMQNKQIDAKRVIESITKYVGKVADNLNVYLQEELFHGRTAKATHDFAKQELEPLMKEIKDAGYELADVEEYLHARHAKEANAVIAMRDPSMPDGGSGMTDAAADAYMKSLTQEDRAKLSAIAAKVDAITNQTRQMYADYGLESQDTVDGWKSMFKHYIPLQREDKEGSGGMGIGQGFSVKGKEVKGRTGSTRKVVDILANIAMQRERLIVRGEKNRVSNALLGLAIANPNPEFWSVGAPPSERVYDPDTNSVVLRPDPLYKSRDNVIVTKVKQPDGAVKEVAVVFNEDDKRSLRMAKALKNLDAGDLEGLLGVSAKITRYFSAVNTQYNPVFGVVNLIRDVQSAMLNLDTTPLARRKGRIARDTVSALTGIYQDMRAERAGQPATSQWSQLWEDFQKEGGQTGYRQMFATSKDRADEMQKVLNPDAWLEGKYSKFFTANGALKVPLSKAKEGAGFIFDWLSDYNESMENGVRLATYKAALDQGMSKQEAASVAKNLTVNFNRKGQIGQQAGAVYAFFNAAMQGSARIGQTLFSMEGGNIKTLRLSSTGKKIVYGGMLLGTMQALALAAAGFNDDDPPEFVRARSLVIPIGDRKYISIPMPQGFNVLPGLGRNLTEFALGGFTNPTKRAIEIFSMFADNFNPIGNAGLSMQTIAPTALDPLVALTENRDFTGKPIARVSSNKAVPGFTQFKDSATVFGKLVAEGINGVTGGNAYVAGALSPTPDQVDYLVGQLTGGVGRELSKMEQTVITAATGQDTPLYKIPLVGRFVGDSQSQASQGGQFYANVNRLNELETEVKAMRKDGKAAEAAQVLRDNPDAYLIAQANVAERQVQRLNREKRELVAKGADREQVKAKETQITAVMMRLNKAMEKLHETAH